MTTILIVAGAIVALALLFGKTNLRRLFGAARGQAGRLSAAAANADPVAVYQVEIDNATEKLQKAQLSLGTFGGLVERLKRQVAAGKDKVGKLEERMRLFVEQDDNARITDTATQLESAQRELLENESQLKQNMDCYSSQLGEIKAAHNKISAARQRAGELQSKLELSKAEAAAAEINASFNAGGGIGSSLDNLGGAERAIQEQIDKNRGNSLLAMDMNSEAAKERAVEEELAARKAKELAVQYKLKYAPKQVTVVATETKQIESKQAVEA